jgi:hypothetical protein
MDSKEIAEHIQGHNYLFQISIPGSSRCFGKKTIEEALTEADNLCDYFNLIAKRNNASQLCVKTFVHNGTSYKEKGLHVVSTAPAIPTSDVHQQHVNNTSTTNVDDHQQPINNTSTTRKERSYNDGLSGLDHPQGSIRAEVLEVKLEFAQRDAKEWRERAEKAETEREKLYRENMELQRENRIKDDKHDLDKQKVLADSKGGLSGFMEEVKSLPPEGWQFLAGCFKDHPMAKGLLQANNNGNQEAAPLHSDPEVANWIQAMAEALKSHSRETVGAITLIVNRFLESPAVMDAIYKKIFPDKKGNDPGKD